MQSPRQEHLTSLQLLLNCRDPLMPEVAKMVTKVANGKAVLVLGETGTGKEVVAKALHECSNRRSEDLVMLDCANMRGDTLRSELFGHEKGAFTGAESQHLGLFEKANGGTAFLDEIGEIPIDEQPRLLRVIQDGAFMRVGGNRQVHSDFKLIAATNRDLPQMVRDGKFREDLYYRLKTFTVQLPPLRSRKADLLRLANHFADEISGQVGAKTLSIEAEKAVMGYDWPGNVRELRSAVERGICFSGDNEEISFSDLGITLPSRKRLGCDTTEDELLLGKVDELISLLEKHRPGQPMIETIKKLVVIAVLSRFQKMREAASILGVDSATLFRFRKQWKLDDASDAPEE